jgi:hypothetical protein
MILAFQSHFLPPNATRIAESQ